MMTPVYFEPGIIFDGRSIILSVAGLFGGPVVAVIAAFMCGVCRLSLGGVGVAMGLSVIVESAALGVAFHFWRRRMARPMGLVHLWFFGLLVHGAMLALTVLLPGDVRQTVLSQLGPAIVGVYPLATILVCWIFLDYEKQRQDREALEQSEGKFRSFFERSNVGRSIIWLSGETQVSLCRETMDMQIHDTWFSVSVDPLLDAAGRRVGGIHIVRDITQRKRAEEWERLAHAVLDKLNDSGTSAADMILSVLRMIQTSTGFAAVGLRLRDGDDFPYYVQAGFSEGFLSTENTLLTRARTGGVCRNEDGSICLECTCGLVLSGKADPADPLCTEGGSWWINNSLPLLDTPADQDPRLHPRNRCIHDGFLSVALIPLRVEDDIVGLLQLNDLRADRFTPEMIHFFERLTKNIAIALTREQTNERLRKLQEQYAQAQKMESVGRLAGGVAHDFNNLLMGIMNYVELCRDGIEPDHPIREWLNEISVDAQRSANLTRQLLAFARKQIISPEVLDFNDAIANMLKLLQRLVGEDVAMAWKPGASLGQVKVDPVQIDQILANLVVNARDAIGGVGLVSIETSNTTFDESYCADHSGYLPGDYTLLTVTDSGRGMDKETLDHIFEPFFTTKDMGRGTGLGLATVYGIVKQNGGFVDVTSEPGQGATFKVYLPRYGGGDTRQTAVATPPERPRGEEVILLVEDEKSIRVTARLFLEDLGYTVLAAEDPKQALKLSAEHDDEIHLLITDVVMPGMSGRDLAQQLSEHRPAIKRIFISGFTADVIAQRGILDHGVTFLPKPFSRDQLARKVRQVLDGKQAGQEAPTEASERGTQDSG